MNCPKNPWFTVPGPASPPPAAQPQNLPALDRLLRLPACAALLDAHGHALVANEARALLATLRTQALAGDLALGQIGADALAAALGERLQRCSRRCAPCSTSPAR